MCITKFEHQSKNISCIIIIRVEVLEENVVEYNCMHIEYYIIQYVPADCGSCDLGIDLSRFFLCFLFNGFSATVLQIFYCIMFIYA